MPAPLAVPLTRFLWVWTTSNGKKATQAIFEKVVTESDPTALSAAAEDAFSVWSTHALRGDTSNQITLDKVECQNWNFSVGPNPIVPVSAAQQSTGAAVAGSFGTQQIPSQDAVTVTLQTGLPGRSFRGRIYWTGFGETAANAGRVSQGFADEVRDFFVDSLAAADLDLDTPVPVVASRVLGVATDVVSFRGNTAVHTQRRRALRS